LGFLGKKNGNFRREKWGFLRENWGFLDDKTGIFVWELKTFLEDFFL
jgi:hypothetical protein